MCTAAIYNPVSILLVSTQFSELCRGVSRLDIGTQRLSVSISAETQDICMVRFRRNCFQNFMYQFYTHYQFRRILEVLNPGQHAVLFPFSLSSGLQRRLTVTYICVSQMQTVFCRYWRWVSHYPLGMTSLVSHPHLLPIFTLVSFLTGLLTLSGYELPVRSERLEAKTLQFIIYSDLMGLSMRKSSSFSCLTRTISLMEILHLRNVYFPYVHKNVLLWHYTFVF